MLNLDTHILLYALTDMPYTAPKLWAAIRKAEGR